MEEPVLSEVKFLHASDIHLGCNQYRNEHRSDDFIRAFQELLSLANLNKVDFILLGGDVFTSLEMLPGKLTRIIEILQDFKRKTDASIPIIAVEGNHDLRKFSRGVRFPQRGQSWLKLLATIDLIVLLSANLDAPSDQIFQPYNFEERSGGKIKIKNTMIYGIQYIVENPESYLSKIRKGINNEDGLFHILLAHFGIQGQMENVPGMDMKYVYPLQHRVHYLALGHFHKPFIIDDWVYNPGSTEASCSSDFSFNRGVYLVQVLENHSFSKQVTKIRLNNRRYIWETVHLPHHFKNRNELYDYIKKKLKNRLQDLNKSLDPSDPNMPILFLVLKGKKPYQSCKIRDSELVDLIIEEFPVVDARTYQKFSEGLTTLNNYL